MKTTPECRVRAFARVAILTTVIAPWWSGMAGRADDWPQWRGPRRDGVSQEADIDDRWRPGGPDRMWLRSDLGPGYGGPAVVGNVLLILGAEGDREMLFAMEADTGDPLWKTEVGPLFRDTWGDGPRSTPTVVGDRVLALGSEGDLLCARVASGVPLWRQSLVDLDGVRPRWGYSESAMVVEDVVVCSPGGDAGTIVGLDLGDGSLRWRTEDVQGPAGYSSPIRWNGGSTWAVVKLLRDRVVVVSTDDGTLLTSASFNGRVAVVPTPILRGDELFLASGYGAGCRLMDLTTVPPNVVYANAEMENQYGGVVAVGDYVYGFSNAKGWQCLEWSTGESVWNERRALGRGSLIAIGDFLICVGEDYGRVVLVEASPVGWVERGRFRLQPQSERRGPHVKLRTPPVVAHGRLYLRDQELLFCFDLR